MMEKRYFAIKESLGIDELADMIPYHDQNPRFIGKGSGVCDNEIVVVNVLSYIRKACIYYIYIYIISREGN